MTDQQQPERDDVHILVVDDDEPVRRSLTRVLEREGYSVTAAASAEEAEDRLNELDFPLVLADITMPGSSGIDLLAGRAQELPETAFVMVTALDDQKLATTALELGAYGYIVKPFGRNEIVINVTNALRRRSLELMHLENREKLEHTLKARTSELWSAISELEHAGEHLRLAEAQSVTRLAMTAELKDAESSGHMERVGRFSEVIALALGMDAERARLLQLAARMHDLGNLGVPDALLLKTGSLTDDERRIVESHTTIGHEILDGSPSELLRLAASIALTHHERFDGSGYPNGLSGTNIPIEGRIVAVADDFDRMTAGTRGTKGVPLGKAIEMMQGDENRRLDPTVVAGLLAAMDQVVEIMQEYRAQP